MYFYRGVRTGGAGETAALPVQRRWNKGGTGAHASQYFEHLAPVPPQYFQQTLGPTKCVPPQYLTPSYAPGLVMSFLAHFYNMLTIQTELKIAHWSKRPEKNRRRKEKKKRAVPRAAAAYGRQLKNHLRMFIWMQKSIEFHLPHLEIPQPCSC